MEFFGFDKGYVDALVSGDSKVEQHFYSHFEAAMMMKLRARALSAETCSDIAQETFSRVFQALRRGGLKRPERIPAFVNSVCNNVLAEYLRHPAARPGPAVELADFATAEDDLVTAERRLAVARALSGLPEKDQRILSAVFLEERTTDEVASEMGVDRSYLRILLHRAKARFRQELERRTPELDPKSAHR
jgi:RNA polymerase sigma-70 factor (ECF subfamily)